MAMQNVLPTGAQKPTRLTSEEAKKSLLEYGSNAVAEPKSHPWRRLLGKFWAPVPWMLEVTILLEIVLKKRAEAIIIGVLLCFNAALSFFQEKKAGQALEMLRRRLSVQARVRRDGRWQLLPSQSLVPGDIVHVRMGDLVPADLRLTEGQVLLDQSSLTGESVPVEASARGSAYAGTVVKRGEASGEVVATGSRTKFGKTAELVRLPAAAGREPSGEVSPVRPERDGVPSATKNADAPEAGKGAETATQGRPQWDEGFSFAPEPSVESDSGTGADRQQAPHRIGARRFWAVNLRSPTGSSG
jgi:magnesium-transporting ATPase (P-type)